MIRTPRGPDRYLEGLDALSIRVVDDGSRPVRRGRPGGLPIGVCFGGGGGSSGMVTIVRVPGASKTFGLEHRRNSIVHCHSSPGLVLENVFPFRLGVVFPALLIEITEQNCFAAGDLLLLRSQFIQQGLHLGVPQCTIEVIQVRPDDQNPLVGLGIGSSSQQKDNGGPLASQRDFALFKDVPLRRNGCGILHRSTQQDGVALLARSFLEGGCGFLGNVEAELVLVEHHDIGIRAKDGIEKFVCDLGRGFAVGRHPAVDVPLQGSQGRRPLLLRESRQELYHSGPMVVGRVRLDELPTVLIDVVGIQCGRTKGPTR